MKCFLLRFVPLKNLIFSPSFPTLILEGTSTVEVACGSMDAHVELLVVASTLTLVHLNMHVGTSSYFLEAS
jgi:hypothetical protein